MGSHYPMEWESAPLAETTPATQADIKKLQAQIDALRTQIAALDTRTIGSLKMGG